jgi:hypothetical protein
MFRKILISLIFIVFSVNIYSSFAIDMPVNCVWLPWCDVVEVEDPFNWETHEDEIFWAFWLILSEWVKWVAVIAVVALMLAGLNLVVGWWLSWEEEKVSNAKKWVLWAFVWVILSVSAWWIINVLNNLKIDN